MQRFLFYSKKNKAASEEKTRVDLTEKFPTKGIYTLIVFLSNDTQLKIGKLGTQTFPAGYYIYTGSALGKGASSLKQRVTRHLKKQKQKFWHIDFLLAHENATITTIIAVQTSRKLECKMNQYIREELKTKIPVMGFGASDCKENCKSHLLFFSDIAKEKVLVKKIVKCARLMSDHVFVINVR